MMRKFNFWKTLAFSVMALTAFAGCSDSDDEGGNTGIPSITVNEAASTSVGVTLEGGSTAAIAVVSNGTWTLSMMPADASSWITPSAMSGSGASSLTFNVAAATVAREATITLTATGSVSGYPITKTATILIKQSEGGSTGEAIYANNFDKTAVTDKSELSDSEAWKNAVGTGISSVTYGWTGKMSVRPITAANIGKYDGASGVNKIFFGTGDPTFDIDNITLPAGAKTFRLVFGANYFFYATKDNIFKPEKFIVTLGNGTGWSGAVTYTKIGGNDAERPNWVYFAADFTLAEAIPNLSIKFTAKEASVFSLDDVKLTEGTAHGQDITFVAEAPTEVKTIAQITAAGKYKVLDATVVAFSKKSLVITDASNAFISVYLGDTSAYAVGDKLAAIEGEVKLNGDGPLQFSLSGETPAKTTGTAPTLAAPEKFDGSKVLAWMTTPVVKYVEVLGTLSISDGKYYNLAIAGVSDVAVCKGGSLDNPTDAQKTHLAALDGQPVVVKGFTVSTYSKYFTLIATDVTADTTTPTISAEPTSLSFTAAGEIKTVAFTAANVGSNHVYAKITGADAGQFTVATVASTSPVFVTAATNSTTDTKSATLEIYIAASEVGTAVASTTVALLQNPSGATNYVPVTIAPQDWAGTYVVGYPTADACSILKEKYSGATATKSTFTFDKLVTPAFDGTNIIYSATYNTIEISKIAGTEFYALKYGDMYIGWTTSTGNSCAFSSDAPSSTTPEYQWTIEIVEGLTKFSCSKHEDGKTRNLQFNSNDKQERFAIYTGTQKNLMLYKR